jgi:hypothetical protein
MGLLTTRKFGVKRILPKLSFVAKEYVPAFKYLLAASIEIVVATLLRRSMFDKKRDIRIYLQLFCVIKVCT